MANLHETRMGQNFFNNQLPQLIQALQKTAAALIKPAAVLKLPLTADSDFLSELYFGNYEPEVFIRRECNRTLDASVTETQKALLKDLSVEALNKLEQYQTAVEARSSKVAEQAYQSGFRTAVQMMVSGLSAPAEAEEPEKDKSEIKEEKDETIM